VGLARFDTNNRCHHDTMHDAAHRHMDSDESVAFGAGLHAANMSTAFRVRKFGAVDAASYALAVEFDVAATETKETPEVRDSPGFGLTKVRVGAATETKETPEVSIGASE